MPDFRYYLKNVSKMVKTLYINVPRLVEWYWLRPIALRQKCQLICRALLWVSMRIRSLWYFVCNEDDNQQTHSRVLIIYDKLDNIQCLKLLQRMKLFVAVAISFLIAVSLEISKCNYTEIEKKISDKKFSRKIFQTLDFLLLLEVNECPQFWGFFF